MELLQGEAFDALFHGFARNAFHLEVQDSYHTPEESEPFTSFLTGQPDDFAWHRPWLDLVRRVTAAGRSITRPGRIGAARRLHAMGPGRRRAQHRRR